MTAIMSFVATDAPREAVAGLARRHRGALLDEAAFATVVAMPTATSAFDLADAVRRNLGSGGSSPRTAIVVAEAPGGALPRGATAELRLLLGAAGPGEVVLDETTRRVAGLGGLLPVAVEDHEGRAWRSPRPPGAGGRITTVVAEDVALVRAGIVALLAEEGFEVAAEASDLDGLLDAARRLHPALVVTDMRMPPSQADEGLRAALALREEQPGLGVMVLSQHVEPSAAALILGRHASGVGYLLKERVTHLEEFARACRSVAEGGVVVDSLVTEALVRRGVASRRLDRLTERELEVLDLMAQGRSNAAICRAAACAPKTLEAHIRSIFQKLDLTDDVDGHRRVAAVVEYLQAKP